LAVGEAGATPLPTTFSFGLDDFGQLGHNTSGGHMAIATPIDTTNLAGKSITQVAGGGWHTLLLADDGTVFSFGWNHNGATGLNTAGGNTLIATPINAGNLAGKKITQVAGGGWHTLLLADDGTVFSFGWNHYGRTGRNTTIGDTLVASPIDIRNLTGKTIVQVAAGYQHSLLLADDGTVFSFGYNSGGQLGLNTDLEFVAIPTPIDTTNLAGKTITQVAAGRSHSLLLANDGAVFSFGWNGDGQTGRNTNVGRTPIATPIDTTNLVGKMIAQIAAGENHNVLTANDGSVFSFGANFLGATGLNTDFGNTLIATPIDTTNLGGKTIVQAAAGHNHNLLLADDGTVFSFGWNGSGRTGLGTTIGNTLVATPIATLNLGGRVATQVAAGANHSLLLTEVPEPSTFALALLAFVPLGRRSRRLPHIG
jgi:alpha-tubulin suppressor-like RCC1 family protein